MIRHRDRIRRSRGRHTPTRHSRYCHASQQAPPPGPSRRGPARRRAAGRARRRARRRDRRRCSSLLFPGRSSSATGSPPLRSPWSTNPSKGWNPNPYFQVRVASCSRECAV